MSEHIENLVKEFNGAIKYTPMLKDHPDWTHEQCIQFAKKWHVVAIEGLRLGHSVNYKLKPWNEGILYCRNVPTQSMLDEASK